MKEFVNEADQRVNEAITADDWPQAREAVSYALWRVESQLGDVEALRPIAARALAAFAKDPLPDGQIGMAWRTARGEA